jgi:hypothetical protein
VCQFRNTCATVYGIMLLHVGTHVSSSSYDTHVSSSSLHVVTCCYMLLHVVACADALSLQSHLEVNKTSLSLALSLSLSREKPRRAFLPRVLPSDPYRLTLTNHGLWSVPQTGASVTDANCIRNFVVCIQL